MTWLSAIRIYLLWIAAVNLIWEFSHVPLYTIWTEGTLASIVFAVIHCTGGDALVGGSSLLAALMIAGSSRWPIQNYWPVAAITMAFGLAYTGFSEWLNTSVRATWAYSELMPIVPGIGIGLSPIAQWLVIPLTAFWVLSKKRVVPLQ